LKKTKTKTDLFEKKNKKERKQDEEKRFFEKIEL